MAKKITKKIKVIDVSRKEILEAGMSSQFWRIIVEALEESIDFIQEQMDSDDLRELSAEQYKLHNELFKAKKQYLNTLINTPRNLISWLGTPDNERKEFDPY